MLSTENPHDGELAPVGRPSVAPHLNAVLPGGLAKWLDEHRAAGTSYEQMMLRLAIDHRVEVSRESIRRWVTKLDAARDAGVDVQW